MSEMNNECRAESEVSEEDHGNPSAGTVTTGQGNARVSLFCTGKDWPKQDMIIGELQSQGRIGADLGSISRAVAKVEGDQGRQKTW